MFVGHLALALGARSAEPKLPLGAAVAAAFGLDLLWPLLLLVGFEVVRVNPDDTAFTHLTFESYPWSHSLATAILWSLIAGLAAGRWLGSSRVGWLLGGLVLSHWWLDLVTHRPDLPLWPGGPVYGLGLWNSLAGTIALEGALIALGALLYLQATVAVDWAGSLGMYAMLAVSTTLWVVQPWMPDPPNATAVAFGALILWVLPVWSRWADRHRSFARMRAASARSRAADIP